MRMTIDEAIKHGEEQLEIFGGEHKEFIEIAIETMRKYQQVQKWFKSYWDLQEQDIMDTIHGKSYDNRWHSVISEKDFEMLVLPQTDGEAIPKDQYEARLKADLKAILVELQLEIEGQKFDTHIDKKIWNNAIAVCSEVILQKIDALKGAEQ